ncbi:hypothetical protein ACFQ49_17420 [Kroppenstedtia eburnea]|uniref:Uncharacterized protein n=1 Tax=Kroppenstedtia eburnea TaxID=714067 RepID=A0A1N7JXT1_9BACL|nr:hypothetical protein [Kroppenstedtia eburnea]EGK10867.1 hypothetical protein HMPREF9374_2231 [Desmospora sp. 8437]SIS54162.1 hypothetical protein SAMN05421790_102348 [Kroppenstedtia eburnea]
MNKPLKITLLIIGISLLILVLFIVGSMFFFDWVMNQMGTEQ